MIAAEHIVMEYHIFDFVLDVIGRDKVVDPPSCIILPGIEPVAPPGIGPFPIRVKMAEGIGEAGLQQLLELRPFLVGEPGIPPVALGVFRSISLAATLRSPQMIIGLGFGMHPVGDSLRSPQTITGFSALSCPR